MEERRLCRRSGSICGISIHHIFSSNHAPRVRQNKHSWDNQSKHSYAPSSARVESGCLLSYYLASADRVDHPRISSVSPVSPFSPRFVPHPWSELRSVRENGPFIPNLLCYNTSPHEKYGADPLVLDDKLDHSLGHSFFFATRAKIIFQSRQTAEALHRLDHAETHDWNDQEDLCQAQAQDLRAWCTCY